jgi:hypothetical protein
MLITTKGGAEALYLISKSSHENTNPCINFMLLQVTSNLMTLKQHKFIFQYW